jgi:hypothetical protein
MILIREIDGHDHEYAGLFQRDNESMLYQSPFWLDLLQEILQRPIRLLSTWEDDRLTAAMPFMVSPATASGPVINSLPFFGSIGGIVSDRTGAEREVHLNLLLQGLVRIAESMEAVSLNIISRPADPVEDAYRDLLAPDWEDVRTTFVLDLPSPTLDSEEALMARLAGRTRTALRKAAKQGFEVARSMGRRDAEALYGLHCENMASIGGIRKPRSFMQAVTRRLDRGCPEIWVARSGTEVIAGALFFVMRESAEYYMTGLSPAFRQSQPLSLLVFEAMKDLAARGIRHFNFGGTWPSQEGLRRFKSGWGATPLPYRYFVKCGSRIGSLLQMSGPEISARYPFFYVIPFSSLHPSTAERQGAVLQ